MPSHTWDFVFPLQTGTTGAIVKSGDMVPLHQIAADTVAGGIPWFMTTTSPSFSTSQPAFQRFSLTTTCPASKRNSIASLMGSSSACKLPEVSRFPDRWSRTASRNRSGGQCNTRHSSQQRSSPRRSANKTNQRSEGRTDAPLLC